MAFQALYSWDVQYSGKKAIPKELLDFSWILPDPGSSARPKAIKEEMLIFSRLLVTGTIENIETIDNVIQKHLLNWELKRLNRVDLALLRMSVYTLMFQTEMSPSIVIDEAIGISKEFSAPDSYKFINGVLDNVRKSLER